MDHPIVKPSYPSPEPSPGISACHREAQELLAIADTLTVVNTKLAASLATWREAMMTVLHESQESLSTERTLEGLALELRHRWIELAQSVVNRDLKSPPDDYLPLLPISGGAYYIYERVKGAVPLEQRLNTGAPAAGDWQSSHVLFTNGMAAIAAVLTCLRQWREKLLPEAGRAHRLDACIGYFESFKLLRLMNSTELPCTNYRDSEEVLALLASGATDMLFLELIAYDWVQSVIDPAKILAALESRPSDRPWVLVVDSTLLGAAFDMMALLAAMGDRSPVMAVEVRSGLKLDQVGLEFANVGLVKVFGCTHADSEQSTIASEFVQALASARKVLGTGLSIQQSAVLDAPWVFHPQLTAAHTQRIFDHNRRLARAMSGIPGMFAQVHHPALGEQSQLAWAESPIVVMTFHPGEDTEENHKLLLAVIAHEVRQRGLVFHRGCSFGFRHHRCEIVVPESGYIHQGGGPRGFLKVAMGVREGPSLEGVIQLLQALAQFADFDALRTAYPDLSSKRALAALPDLQSLRTTR
ncbi:hypothetical protein GPB2148_2521 [marine gamma proteobacterium HTCC2148]|nr:hypothetical protein GPB2148_2521 [marine gamma proteobacterium HTCC2148]